MHYYGTRLSENISRREPEGYLLCLNVPVARTGTQDYLPEELGMPSGPDLISVFRPEDEVFAPETMASFEGMPVTNDHPPDGVDIENIRRLQMGHAHNVRRGSGEESDLLLADLIITDPRLIDLILGGKREISCGYTYELAEENGQFIQRKIRGNHIAVVDAGRAGKRVCIRDHKGVNRDPQAPPEPAPRVSIKDHKRPERSSFIMKKSLSKILARMAKDGDVEAVAEIIGEMIGEETPAEAAAEAVAAAAEAAETVEGTEQPVVVEAPEAAITIDEESIAGIIERLDRLIALLSPAGDEDPAAPPEEIAEVVEEVVEAAAAEEVPYNAGSTGACANEITELVESIVEPEVSAVIGEIEGDEDDPEAVCSQDALRAALKAVRPALARMSRSQRRKVCADLSARLKMQRKGSDAGYAALRRAAHQSAPAGMDLGKRIMAARNPHYTK